MNPVWRVYKSKVLKTLNPEYEDEAPAEETEMESDVNPVQEDDGPNAVSQLARKMQGAGTKSWNRLSSLFNRDDEHQLLEETESPPVADHPLAVKPEEPPRPAKRSAFWESFATNWAAKKQADAAAAAAATAASEEAAQGEEAAGEDSHDGKSPQEEEEGGGGGAGGGGGGGGGAGGGGGGRSNNSFSKYVSLGGGSEDASFKWNFVTSKLAELKTKSN